MGKTASRGARGRYPEEHSADARTAENPGVGSQDRPTGAGESNPEKPSPRGSAPHGVRNTPTTLTPLDSGRLLFGGRVPVKKPDPGEVTDPLVVARFVTPFRNVI